MEMDLSIILDSLTGDETYWEVYTLTKSISKTQEDFNDKMSSIRNAFLDKKYKRGRI